MLNKMIYSKDDIIYTIRKYKNISEISISENTKYYICEFTKCKYYLDITIGEFENYLINLLNASGLKNDNY